MRHQRILGRLYLALGNWLEDHAIGEVFMSPLDVVFTPYDVVEPDLFYVSNERAADCLLVKHATGADLAIEIASPGTRRRDETVKLRLYERAGVAEYWFVDPDENLVRVYRRHGDRFGAAVELVGPDVLTTSLVPGFELSVGALLRD